MTTFIIERNIEGAADLSADQLAGIAAASNAVVAELGVPYTWITSYVAGDKIYCVHETENIDTIYEHARRGGFPVDIVVPVANTFGPGSAGDTD